jgi:hypothetical protein
VFLLQTTTGATTTPAPDPGPETASAASGPSPECASDPKCVYLDPQQLGELATQMQGNTFFLSGMVGMVVFCVGLMALVSIVGGR